MAQYYVHPVETQTKNGEVKITLVLELNINFNSNGEISIQAKNMSDALQNKPKEDSNWEIPDFGGEKIEFGKKE